VSAVLNPDGTINSATNPASVGAVVMLVIDIGQLPSPDAVPASTTIGGLTAPMVPMTTVTGHPGKEQFQVQVPQGVQTGPSVPVVVQFKNADATARLTIAIQ
jgi:uncharacterized protein (TIGR03437 family)